MKNPFVNKVDVIYLEELPRDDAADGEDYMSREDVEVALEEIEEREDEIDDLFNDFLGEIIFDGVPEEYFMPEEIAEMRDDVIEMLALKYGVPVYRPVFIQDDNGDFMYVEHPYESNEE